MTDTDLQRYSHQYQRGFRQLHFEGALEREFRDFFYRRGLLRQRAAIALGLVLMVALAPLDLPRLPPDLQTHYLWLRIYIVCPVMIMALVGSFYLERLLRYYQWVAIAIVTYLGFVTNGLVLAANREQTLMPYEGINLIMMTSFLLAGLMFRFALISNALIVLSYFAFARWFGAPVTGHEMFFIAGHWAVGATGGYVIEYNSRYNFLQQGMMSALAQTDSLTGIFNRGALDKKLREIFHYAQREKKPLCLLMVDIDYFKRYNDLYGHIQGDHCIYQVAHALDSCCRRPLDFAGRYGGEEFLLLWFDTPEEEAGRRREAVQRAIQALQLPHAGSEAAPLVTVSGGMITGTPDGPASLDHFLQAADDGLYRAKSAGRNQITLRAIP